MSLQLSVLNLIRLFFCFLNVTRICNGSRQWVSDPNIQSLPDYECAATGQDQYKTFDGKHFRDHRLPGCEVDLMLIKNTSHNVRVSNVRCKDSIELLMCKKVVVTTKYGKVELLQKDITITLKGTPNVIGPGNYPEPCVLSSLPHTEIFSVGLFTFVRVFSPDDRVVPLYLVSTFLVSGKLTTLPSPKPTFCPK